MPARLFRRIQFRFSRLNKTLLLSTAVFLFAAFFIGVPAVKAQVTSCGNNTAQCGLDNTYAPYFTNFDSSSGITGGTVENATANNTIQGLAFTIDLSITTNGAEDSNQTHWDRVDNDLNAFIIKLCPQDNSGNCYLNSVTYTNRDVGNDHQIFIKNANGNYASTEHIQVSAFDSSNNLNQTNSGQTFSWNSKTGTSQLLVNTPISIAANQTYTASFWYCASGSGQKAVNAYQAAHVSTQPGVTTFGADICDGWSYFLIGSPLTFTTPATATDSQQQAQTSQQNLAKSTTTTSSEDSNLPACGLVWGQNGTINGCAAQLAYGIYELCAWIAGLLGQLFDFFIGYSLSDASYRYAFAVTGWQLVRDISNIFFILIMVWTGFSAVFDTEHSSVKSLVPQLIINALLINFSLFATRLVIDISNVTARIFYSQMVVCQESAIKANGGLCTPAQADRTGPGGYWKLSAKIVSSFDPQKLFAPNILQPPNFNASNDKISGANSVSNFSSQQVGSSASVLSERDYANYFGIICILAAIIMLLIGVMFFKTSFLFIGRVVGLYLCMIFSPFAFLSLKIPFFKKLESLRWDDWKGELTSYALLAPVFVFLLYIIYILLTSNFAAQMATVATNSNSVMEVILSIAIPMAIIYTLITKATSIAQSLSGDIGKRIQGVSGKIAGYAGAVGGIALGIATDGASLVATKSTKLTALSDAKRAELEARKAAGGPSGWAARQRLNASDWTQRQNFNLRNTGLYQKATGKLGIKTNEKFMSAIGLGKDVTKGGREAMIKASGEVTNKKIGSIKTNIEDSKVADFWKNHIGKETDKMAMAAYFAEKMKEAKTDDEKKALRKAKKEGTYKNDARYAELLTEKQKKTDETYGKVTNNKELTKALQTQYAATILRAKDPGQNPEFDIPRMGVLAGATAKAATVLGLGATGTIGGLGVLGLAAKMSIEDEGRRKAAKKFLDDSAKELKKEKEKAERAQKGDKRRKEYRANLDAQHDEVTERLEKFEKGITEALTKVVSEKVNGDTKNASKTKEEKQQMINSELARLKDDSKAASETIKEFRDNLKNTFEMINLDLNYLNGQHKDYMKEVDKIRNKIDKGGLTPEQEAEQKQLLQQAEAREKDSRKKLSAKLAEKGSVDEHYKATDPALGENLKTSKARLANQIDQAEEREQNIKKTEKAESEKPPTSKPDGSK